MIVFLTIIFLKKNYNNNENGKTNNRETEKQKQRWTQQPNNVPTYNID